MSWYGDPDGLHRLAAQLSSAAGRARDRAVEVRATSAAARWRGPAAEAFHASVYRESAVLERAADELEDGARALHRHADNVRHELDRLLAAEREAKHLIGSAYSHVVGWLT